MQPTYLGSTSWQLAGPSLGVPKAMDTFKFYVLEKLLTSPLLHPQSGDTDPPSQYDRAINVRKRA